MELEYYPAMSGEKKFSGDTALYLETLHVVGRRKESFENRNSEGNILEDPLILPHHVVMSGEMELHEHHLNTELNLNPQ
jgi:hypothetical protein